ncbi:Mur ligase family protein [Psychrobacter alimentarius]|uniref:Mur ligase family protein n=1 Tax=Psychrobacter TaxID=497 RepID=UPI000BAAB075|nr:Mur ligase family protein [Psychrobacter sp. JB193]PAT62191.1 Mur ligase [Psychrobacter sp. JB193]
MDESIKIKRLMSHLKQNLPAIYDNWIQTHIAHIDNKNNIKASSTDTLPGTFVLSISDGYKKAKTVTFIVDDLIKADKTDSANRFTSFEKILPIIHAKVDKLSAKFDAPIVWLRLEWLHQATFTTWADLQQDLKRFKRNYYRSGIAFEGMREPWLLLTETELNANACLYAGNTVAHAQVNTTNLDVYFKARHGSSQLPNLRDDLSVISFNTAGMFLDGDTGDCHNLDIQPRFKGHRKLLPLSAATTQPIIEHSTQYLARQVQPSGQYVYGYFPCFDRKINTYNSLRHASSTYALIEGYEACRGFSYLNSSNSLDSVNVAAPAKLSLTEIQNNIDGAMSYLTHQLIHTYDDKAYVIDTGGEIKLGANAVAILALVKYLQVFADTPLANEYRDLANKLALGITEMQQEDGSFVHVLHKDLTLKAKHRIIYYDGEAAFALMRLYGLTKDERWLNCVTRAFDYFIEAKHHRAHDHWLSYCSNELVIYKPEKKYFQFAVNNIAGYTDFIKNRITTFPTLLELSMAFHKMLLKLDEHPEFHDVLIGFDTQHFYQALHARANHLMNGFFFPEMAMFYKAPQTILHGFFIRHHSFRVRIDDVEHYLSGLIAYQNLLKTAQYPTLATKQYQKTKTIIRKNDEITSQPPQVNCLCPKQSVLKPRALIAATKGRWLVTPAEDWSATGLCIWPPSFESGHILVTRGKTMDVGYISKKTVASLIKKGAVAIVTDDMEAYKDMGVPVLYVRNVRQATMDVGRYARQAFDGQVIGITGSAGKTTTVHMLAHTLNGFGKANYTQSSANLPVGIAWNLACMPPSNDYWVLEMAIGSMSANTDLVRPDVALITNIAPAHLEYHHNVDNIALKKSRIFEGMAPGSLAVVCRDIEQYELIERLARIWGIRVISYGKHDDAVIRLVNYSKEDAQAQIVIDHKTYTLNLSARGQHMVLNAMAILAVAQHYHLSIDNAITRLESFTAVAGRGQVLDTTYQGRAITLYDDAYNANPLSMQSALETFQQLAVPAHQKVLILGDMLELGNDSSKYHLALAPIIEAMDFRVLILVGEQTKVLADQLKLSNIHAHYAEDTQTLATQIPSFIKNNDHVFIKASNGIGLNKLFLREQNDAVQNQETNSAGLKNRLLTEVKTNAAILVERFELDEHQFSEHKVITSVQPNTPKMMASLAKLMTVMLIWDKVKQDSIDPAQTLIEMPVDLLKGSSEYYQFYKKGEKIPLIILIKSALIASSNEAAFALACWHSGSETNFVPHMVRKSHLLGLTQSHWSSCTGLERRAYTTAQDMSTLAKVFISQYAAIASYCSLKIFKYNNKKVFNTNKLIRSYINIKGLKTGNLVGIGSNLINYWVDKDIHYISIVLEAENRETCYALSEIIIEMCV